MHCDEIFDILTCREPDRHPGVLAHLQQCPRCRDLDEALAPLRAGLESPFPAESEFALSSSVSSLAVQVAKEAASQLQPVLARTASPSKLPRWRYVAAFLSGVGAAWTGVGLLTPPPAPAIVAGSASDCLWLNRDKQKQPPEALTRACMACHLPSK